MMDSSKKKKPRQGKKPRRKASRRNGRGTEQRQSRHVNDKKDESQMWWWKSRWIHPKLSSSNPRCLWTIALTVRPNDGSTWRGRIQNHAYEIENQIVSFFLSVRSRRNIAGSVRWFVGHFPLHGSLRASMSPRLYLDRCVNHRVAIIFIRFLLYWFFFTSRSCTGITGA